MKHDPALDRAFEGELDAVRDEVRAVDSFARELYGALCNMRWRRIGDADREHLASMSWRMAGGVVADLYGEGGDYIDWYCSGNEGEVSERVRARLAALGWEPVPWPEAEL